MALLHWLPVHVTFQVLLYVNKWLNGQAAQYITYLLNRKCSRPWRSSNRLMLTVPRSHLKLKDDRTFTVAAPSLWNYLPVHIRLSSDVDSFKTSLKTYLFKWHLDQCSFINLCVFLSVYVFYCILCSCQLCILLSNCVRLYSTLFSSGWFKHALEIKVII